MRTPTAVRGDIQGLRAVAVLTVIAAHAGLPGVPGGFVGVDVFFVISGYLISSLLFREVDRSGRVSLSGFYARRARRILPAATVVTVATVVASLLWLSLIDARLVLTDAVWATFFAANIHFAAQGVDYFAADQGPSPLQHYWSLSVEEQFYLVWPLLLLACVLLARRRAAGAGLPRRQVGGLLLVVTAVSFGYSVVTTATSSVDAYFSTFTRAWELGIGALAALAASRLARVATPRLLTLMAATGLVAIAVACVTYGPETPFPGSAAALPVLGSALVLLGGVGATTLPGRLLSLAPMRVVGDWSYSLYLWHWPVLIIAERHLARDLRAVETTAVLVLVFVLSWATYRWVETPFRVGGRAPGIGGRRALTLYPASLLLVVASCGAGWWYIDTKVGESGDSPAITTTNFGVDDEQEYRLAGDPAVALVQASVIAARQGMALPSDLTPDLLELDDSIPDLGECNYQKDVRKLCPRGDPDGDKTLVITGDSHGMALIPTLDVIAEHAGWKAYYLVKPMCNAAHVSVGTLGGGDPFPECDEFKDWVVEQVEELQPDLMLVTSAPPVHGVFDGDELVEDIDGLGALLRPGYDDLFAALEPHADRVVLIRDVPKSYREPGTCLTTGEPDLGTCMFEPFKRSQTLGNIAVDVAEARGVEVVDPYKWLCWDGSCPVVVGSTITYRDASHLTVEYAAHLGEPLGRALGIWN